MLIKASALYRIIGGVFDPPLIKAGFRRIDQRTWMRRSKDQIREIVHVFPPHSYLGASPVWDLSLDYVPHASYRLDYNIGWNSHDDDWTFDLLHNPLDVEWDARENWCVPTHRGRDVAYEGAVNVLAGTLTSASAFFSAILTPADLPIAFEAKRVMKRVRYGPEAEGNLLPQETLAYAFTLKRLGRAEEGRPWLDSFIAHDRIMPRAVRVELTRLYAAEPQAPTSSST
jgi:hypothetical protein